MKNRKTLMATAAGLLMASALGGAYAASQADGSGHDDEAKEIAAVLSAKISMSDAIRLAEENSKGKAFEARMQYEDGAAKYEINTVSGDQITELSIDPATGKVLESDRDGLFSKLMGKDKDFVHFAAAKKTLIDAIAGAEQANGGKAIEVEMEEHSTNPIFAVEIASKDGVLSMVTVDATSGMVLATSPVTDDDGDNEKN